jgi:hypothetical protein
MANAMLNSTFFILYFSFPFPFAFALACRVNPFRSLFLSLDDE